MRRIQIGFDTVLTIPDAWRQFVFNGFVYEMDWDGRFVVRRGDTPVRSEKRGESR